MASSKKYLKIGEVAQMLGISTQTLRNYQRRGLLVPEIIFDSGHRKYSVEQVENFIKKELEI